MESEKEKIKRKPATINKDFEELIDDFQLSMLKKLLKEFNMSFSKFLNMVELLLNFKSYDEILDFINVNGENENE